MSKKLTPWFPGDVKPVRVGYYERDWDGGGNAWEVTPDFWNGDSWENVYFDGARDRAEYSRQDHPWRGLAKKPATKDAEVSQ